MRFTPTSNWDLAAEASHRLVNWTRSVRKTTSLSDGLFSGTWTPVDSFIVEFPEILQNIEMNTGQFKSDNIQVKVRNIDWWDSNVFNAASNEYIEFRALISIGIGDSRMSSDDACMFVGFIDNKSPDALQYDNEADTITFNVYTADDLANKISCLNINTQYVNTNIDGLGGEGVILPKIPGIFVVDVNIASYAIKKGIHTITYDYNAGSPQIKIDDGDYTALPGADGLLTISNKNVDQKIQFYIALADIATSVDPIDDYVIVESSGHTFPQQPHFGLSTQEFLKLLYNEIGITSISFNDLSFNTQNGNSNLSFYDSPPQDISITGKRTAVTFDGTYLYVAVGDVIYKRNMTTGEYSSFYSLPAGSVVAKMIYNSRNNDIWILYDDSGDGSTFVHVMFYNLGGGGASGVYDLFTSCLGNAADIIDYNYAGSSYVYGVLFVDSTNLVFLDNTLTGYNISLGNAENTLVYVKSGNQIFFFDNTAYAYKFHIDGTGSFVDDGRTTHLTQYSAGMPCAYNPSSDKIFFFDTGGVQGGYWTPGGGAATLGLPGVWEYVFYGGDTHCYASYVDAADNIKYLHNLDSGSRVAKVAISVGEGNVCSTYNASGVLFGIDMMSRLFRLDSILVMSFTQGITEDVPIREIMTKALTAYNLIGKISSHKNASIYRRGNDSGTLQTSGDIVNLDSSNITKVSKLSNSFPSIGYVEVSNSDETHSYDGTNFDTKVFSDVIPFKMSNNFLPTYLLKDIAKYIFQFFNSGHDKYLIETNIARGEFEIFDQADVIYNDGYITIHGATSSDPKESLIVGDRIRQDMSVAFEVIL